ncbi:MAG: chromosome segregation protein SMC [Rhizobiales bacterium]|nr:chromosome segregation protein SMC [Hyphomicrobiales bacterium]
MQITRLRLQGFKSFVDPAELVIAPGLTGVVGPNGCGKSNLLEALRWVMGETSHKSMRAALMDDVIFSGTDRRPARNMAEVVVTIDNAGRTAPAAFNDSDLIEISRRIERSAGSAYRINGRDTRARDVRLLFEDAATGARSNALVRQGQIGEIVNAKPEQRRRILEDAAGIAGLHSRRREAELRLEATEANLARVDDILGQFTTQMNGLKRQARQARRYRELSEEIKRLEALQFHYSWLAAERAVEDAETGLRAVLAEVGRASAAETAGRTELERLNEALGPLRQQEMVRAAVLQRLQIEVEGIAREEADARARLDEVQGRIAQCHADRQRAEEARIEAHHHAERLAEEKERLNGALARLGEGVGPARTASASAREASLSADAALETLNARLAEATAERRRIESSISSAESALEQARRQQAGLTRDRDGLTSERAALGDPHAAAAATEAARKALVAAIEAAEVAHRVAAATSDRRDAARERDAEARLAAATLASEVKALRQFVAASALDDTASPRPVLDLVTVAPGYEKALGSALGDDLVASLEAGAPVQWTDDPASETASRSDPPLPEGAEPLRGYVEAPRELHRRLAQIGIVADEATGDRLAPALRAGQRLVSPAGALWRWDGLRARSEAPSAATVRLIERNRLASLESELAEREATAARLSAALADAIREADAARAESATRDVERRGGETTLRAAEERARALETAIARLDDRLAAAATAIAPLGERIDELERHLASERALVADEGGLSAVRDQRAAAMLDAQERRRQWTEAEALVRSLERELALVTERNAAVDREVTQTANRAERAVVQIEELARRLANLGEEEGRLAGMPGEIEERRIRLLASRAGAENERAAAADALARAEGTCRSCAEALKALQQAMNAALEERGRAEARLEAARNRRAEHSLAIRNALDVTPEACLALAGYGDPADGEANRSVPTPEETAHQLERLRGDRERLGGVNLRAETELDELSVEHDRLEGERADLVEAIAKLRQAIQKLNREGRRRLLEAFEAVNASFRQLFTTLFDGGTADLQLIEGDDPLEGGLELIARPPGKKPATLSLLSGGEQALTAMALIFAVFLTNPSPICVLDEVDAPLDDANVGRFCRLLEDMAKRTDTRFLVITHHPMTMSRMDRLYGVTMLEKGVSQLVSVDFSRAAALRQAS